MIKRAIKEYTVITFGTVLAAVAIYFFMLPSNLAVGSGTALAMVLSNFIPLPVSAISLTINVILLMLGFILIGPEFGAKTVYAAILLPITLGVFEFIFPANRISAIGLCPTGKSRSHVMAMSLLLVIEWQIVHQQRSWADDTHIPF